MFGILRLSQGKMYNHNSDGNQGISSVLFDSLSCEETQRETTISYKPKVNSYTKFKHKLQTIGFICEYMVCQRKILNL